MSQACKFALCMCVPHLDCAELAAAFYKYLQEGRSVHFGEFLNSTCKHLVRGVLVGGRPAWGGQRTPTPYSRVPQMHHFPDLLGRLVSTNLFYFKSSWDDVRAAAPMFTGKQALSLAYHTSHLSSTQLIPSASGFLVLHAEPEQKPQVDLEQLIVGEHTPKSRTHGPLPHPNLPISVGGSADPVGTRRD